MHNAMLQTDYWATEGNFQAFENDASILRVTSVPEDIRENISFTAWHKSLWLPESYELHVRARTLSPRWADNINLFLNATLAEGGDVLDSVHSGDYNDYHTYHSMYIFTLTGNGEAVKQRVGPNAGWSRVRRDPGFHLLSEDTSTATPFNTPVDIRILKQGNRIIYELDGKTIHDLTDSAPLVGGRVGLRTWNTSVAFEAIELREI